MTRALAVVLVSIVGAAPAAGDPVNERITDGTPFVLEPGEVRIGLLRSSVGLPPSRFAPGLEIGTYPLPWLAWLGRLGDVDIQFYNAQVKGQLVDRGPLAVSATAALFYGYIGGGDEGGDRGGGDLLAIPLESHVAYDLHRDVTLIGGLQYSFVSVGAGGDNGEGGEGEDEDGRFAVTGVVKTDTAHLFGGAEWRLGRRWALIGELRGIAFGRVRGEVESRADIDAHTEVEARLRASALPFGRLGYAARGVVHYARGAFNLRFGASYGNYTLPGLNLAIPSRIWMPTLDLYLRL